MFERKMLLVLVGVMVMGGIEVTYTVWYPGKKIADRVRAKKNDALLSAASKGDNAGVTSALKKGATDKDGALFAAVNGGYKDTVELLIEKGANVNVEEVISFFESRKPLHEAVKANREDIVELLIAKGADVNAAERVYLCTPLHIAAQGSSKDVVELLITKGANVNAVDRNGITPLHYAVQGNHKDIVALLIARGADVNADIVVGGAITVMVGRERTPLQWAVYYGFNDIADMLRKAGAKETPDSTTAKPTGKKRQRK